jgi:flagella synthesis protein FlgN
MMGANGRSEMESLLSRMQQAVDALSCSLDEERAAIRGLDVAALDSTNRSKQQALADIEDCERVRRQFCARGGVSVDRSGMLALIESMDGADALSARWTRIVAALNACYAANRAAGILLRSSRRRVADAIALLRGGAGERGLYGPDGRARQSDHGAPLASA